MTEILVRLKGSSSNAMGNVLSDQNARTATELLLSSLAINMNVNVHISEKYLSCMCVMNYLLLSCRGCSN